MSSERQTIVHNVSDEPIIVEQSDGSHLIVLACSKRPAQVPNEIDALTPPAPNGQTTP